MSSSFVPDTIITLILFLPLCLIACGPALQEAVPDPIPILTKLPATKTVDLAPEDDLIQSAPSNTSTPITTRMQLSKAPLLNETVALTLTVSSALDAPDTTAAILLPRGATRVSGELEWIGNLKANEPRNLYATIKFSQEGNWTLEGRALHQLKGGDSWGDAARIYLHVSQDNSHVGFGESQPLATPEEIPSEPPAINPHP
jgi:hypothetical protein